MKRISFVARVDVPAVKSVVDAEKVYVPAVIVPFFIYTGFAAEPTVELLAVGTPALRYIGFVPEPTVELPSFEAVVAEFDKIMMEEE